MFDRMHRFPARGVPDPYVRWGDSRTLVFSGVSSGTTVQGAEFQRITLPRPTVCRIHYHVEVVDSLPPGPSGVDWSTFEYRTGTGSSQANMKHVFMGLPQAATVAPQVAFDATPLDFSFEECVHDLYGRVEAQAFNCSVRFTVWLAPIALENLKTAENQ